MLFGKSPKPIVPTCLFQLACLPLKKCSQKCSMTARLSNWLTLPRCAVFRAQRSQCLMLMKAMDSPLVAWQQRSFLTALYRLAELATTSTVAYAYYDHNYLLMKLKIISKVFHVKFITWFLPGLAKVANLNSPHQN